MPRPRKRQTTFQRLEDRQLLAAELFWSQSPAIGTFDLENSATLGEQTFFVADQPNTGRELWVTKGSASSTHLLKDIADGPNDAWPESLTQHNQSVYFTAGDAANGHELWISDGTSEGTTRLTYFASESGRVHRPTLADAGTHTIPLTPDGLLVQVSYSHRDALELVSFDGTDSTELTSEFDEGSRVGTVSIAGSSVLFIEKMQSGGRRFWLADTTSKNVQPVDGLASVLAPNGQYQPGIKMIRKVNDSVHGLLETTDGVVFVSVDGQAQATVSSLPSHADSYFPKFNGESISVFSTLSGKLFAVDERARITQIQVEGRSERWNTTDFVETNSGLIISMPNDDAASYRHHSLWYFDPESRQAAPLNDFPQRDATWPAANLDGFLTYVTTESDGKQGIVSVELGTYEVTVLDHWQLETPLQSLNFSGDRLVYHLEATDSSVVRFAKPGLDDTDTDVFELRFDRKHHQIPSVSLHQVGDSVFGYHTTTSGLDLLSFDPTTSRAQSLAAIGETTDVKTDGMLDDQIPGITDPIVLNNQEFLYRSLGSVWISDATAKGTSELVSNETHVSGGKEFVIAGNTLYRPTQTFDATDESIPGLLRIRTVEGERQQSVVTLPPEMSLSHIAMANLDNRVIITNNGDVWTLDSSDDLMNLAVQSDQYGLYGEAERSLEERVVLKTANQWLATNGTVGGTGILSTNAQPLEESQIAILGENAQSMIAGELQFDSGVPYRVAQSFNTGTNRLERLFFVERPGKTQLIAFTNDQIQLEGAKLFRLPSAWLIQTNEVGDESQLWMWKDNDETAILVSTQSGIALNDKVTDTPSHSIFFTVNNGQRDMVAVAREPSEASQLILLSRVLDSDQLRKLQSIGHTEDGDSIIKVTERVGGVNRDRFVSWNGSADKTFSIGTLNAMADSIEQEVTSVTSLADYYLVQTADQSFRINKSNRSISSDAGLVKLNFDSEGLRVNANDVDPTKSLANTDGESVSINANAVGVEVVVALNSPKQIPLSSTQIVFPEGGIVSLKSEAHIEHLLYETSDGETKLSIDGRILIFRGSDIEINDEVSARRRTIQTTDESSELRVRTDNAQTVIEINGISERLIRFAGDTPNVQFFTGKGIDNLSIDAAFDHQGQLNFSDDLSDSNGDMIEIPNDFEVLRSENDHGRFYVTAQRDKTIIRIDSTRQQNHNWFHPADVNLDGKVTSIDALAVINLLTIGHKTHDVAVNTLFPDVNRDNRVTAQDALRVVNEIGKRTAGVQAVGEQLSASPAIDAVFESWKDEQTYVDELSGLF